MDHEWELCVCVYDVRCADEHNKTHKHIHTNNGKDNSFFSHSHFALFLAVSALLQMPIDIKRIDNNRSKQ